jgi:hypothetical protein
MHNAQFFLFGISEFPKDWMRQKASPTSGKTSKLSIQYTGNTVTVSKYLLTCQVTWCQWTDCFPTRLLDAPFSIMKMWHLLQRVSGQPSQVSCMTSSPSLLIQSSSALLQGKEVTCITTQLPTSLLSFPCHEGLYMMPFLVPRSGGPHGTQGMHLI